MSHMSWTLHGSFPVTYNHHHVYVNAPSTLFSHRQYPTQQTSRSSSYSISTPLTLTHFTTSHSLIKKRPASSCSMKPNVMHTDTAQESENKQKKAARSWFTKWEPNLWWFVGMPVLAASAPFAFDEGAVRVSVALAFLSGFGVTVGYHRLLSHRSFKVPKWLEYFLAYCGLHALQRDPIFWASVHKLHHKYADTKMDPYTPFQGFWFGHIAYFIYNDFVVTKCGNYLEVSELKAQGFYRFLQDTYFWHPAALATLLYLYGGFPYLVWGMGVRMTVLNLMTYIAFYFDHKWGERAWNTPDTSINNWWVSILCLGEGWHNNHHAFPKSARHGLEWWQLDVSWELIKFLELVGLATDVKLPTEADKTRMASLDSNQAS